jgi:hypothetical protein
MLRSVMPIVVAVTLMAPAAMGEEAKNACPERPADEAIARDLAGDYFISAGRSFKKELFDDALAKFLCSLRLVEHENTVFNIAHVTNFVTDKEAALHLFYAYVDDYPDGETTDEIREIIFELEEMLGKEGFGRQYPLSDGTTGMEDESFQRAEEKASSDVAKEGIKMSKVVEIATWTSLGVGGTSLVIAGILQGVAVSAKNQAEKATTYNDFLDAKEKRDSLQTAAIAMFVSAGIFGGAGAALMLWDKGLLEGKTKSEVTLSLVPLPSGVVLEGRF